MIKCCTREEDVEGECNPYENLANAIIIQAAADYKHKLNKINCGATGSEYSNQYESELDGLRRFFRGEYFQVLTNIDGEFIIQGLERFRK